MPGIRMIHATLGFIPRLLFKDLGLRLAAAVLTCLSLAMPVNPAAGQDAEATEPSMAGRSTVYAPNAAVATSQPLATSAAMEILQAGGNAFDAAVAAAAVLGVVEPHMTGMGGDMFMLAWSAEEGRLVGLDGSGRAGSRLDADALLADGQERMPYRGAVPVTVPGALSGWSAMLERYGTVPLAQALDPAIRIASEGFPVSPIIAKQWAESADVLKEDPGASATYLLDGARAPMAGEWFRNPDLAATYRAVADGGPGVLYGGALGSTLVEGLEAMGGTLTLEDLANHQPHWVEPLRQDFRGYTVWQLPPSGQGIAALQMMGILEAFDLKSMGHNSAEYLHHLVEAKKLAYADLDKYVADPEWMEIDPMDLLDPEYLDGQRAKIRRGVAADRPDPDPAVQSSETIYLSVADKDGNMVSFINSVYAYFGSGVVVPGTGMMLQNRGAGFTLEAGHPNRAAPGKRPFHTIIPGFVTRAGEPWMAFGLMGGAMQPQGHAQLLLNLIEFEMDPQDAVDAARFRHLSGSRVAVEAPVSPQVRASLEAMGHEVVVRDGGAFGGAQLVIRLDRGWAAASDPRKDGHAAGN